MEGLVKRTTSCMKNIKLDWSRPSYDFICLNRIRSRPWLQITWKPLPKDWNQKCFLIVDDVLLRFDDDGGIGKNSDKLPDIFSTAGVSIVKRLQKKSRKDC